MMLELAGQETTLQDYEKRWLFDLPAEHRFRLRAAGDEPLPALDPASLQAVIWSRGPARCADVPRALTAITRALRPDGRLLLHDFVVPGSRLRGKKARREREAGDYINTWARFADPRHRRYFALDAWQDMLAAAGLRLVHSTAVPRTLDFAAWLGDAPRSAADVTRLEVLLLRAPERAAAFLTPQRSPARITFQFTDCYILAQLAQPIT